MPPAVDEVAEAESYTEPPEPSTAVSCSFAFYSLAQQFLAEF